MRDLFDSYLECVWLFVHEFETCLNLNNRYWVSLSLLLSVMRRGCTTRRATVFIDGVCLSNCPENVPKSHALWWFLLLRAFNYVSSRFFILAPYYQCSGGSGLLRFPTLFVCNRIQHWTAGSRDYWSPGAVSYVQCLLERMLAGYPRFPERHFASLCPSVQMWVLRLKFQWHKRHRLSVQDSCSTASPNSAEHFSSRIVAYRSMAEESQQLLFETDSEPGLQATPRPEELQHTLFSWTRQNIVDSQVFARTAECSHSVWLALCYICEDQCHVEINRNIMLHLDMQAPCRQTWCLCACPYVLCLFVCV